MQKTLRLTRNSFYSFNKFFRWPVMNKQSNPIYWREKIHQRRIISNQVLSRHEWIVVVCVGMGLALMICAVPKKDAFLGATLPLYIFHLIMALRAITAGIHSFSYEHRNETWEMLILTGITAPKIFFGKW